MFEVTVESGFSSGHYLRNYYGKCENPHGHNYRVFLTLIGADLDEAGMLVDFVAIKRILRSIADTLDHKMINDLDPFTTLNPSAENLARYIFQQVSERLTEIAKITARVKECVVYETDTSSARYYE